MADKIKKFFKNKKIDSKFKKAGPGYRLDDTPSSSDNTSKSNNSDYQPLPNRSGLTQESKQAAAAALARLNKQQKNDAPFNNSLAAIRAQVRREMEAEKQAASSIAADLKSRVIPKVELETSPLLAVQGVYFRCPLLGPEVLSKEEWNKRIREFLYEQLSEEKGLTACLILHTLNSSKSKVESCIETISKYFENILKNPTEEKYRKIRLSNKVYQEKVKPLEGAQLILEAAGFEVKRLPFQDKEEEFMVFPEQKLPQAAESFEILLDALRNAEPVTLELDRNLQVLLPQEARERNELPPSFFDLTVEEIKREQQLRAEAVERNQMLRTKEMRERDEIREIRKYKFVLIRVRFPNGIFLQQSRKPNTVMLKLLTLKLILENSWEYARPVFPCFIDLEKAYDRVPRGWLWEVLKLSFMENFQIMFSSRKKGTFGVYEKISAVIDFVKEALEDENLPFTLTSPNGQHLGENSEATLFEKKLVPAVILVFTSKVPKDSYLKPEILMLVESLTLS